MEGDRGTACSHLPPRLSSDEGHRVLREDLGERRLGEAEVAALKAAIGRRQEQLAEEALPLGRCLYAERPKDFTRRLRRYWETWRG